MKILLLMLVFVIACETSKTNGKPVKKPQKSTKRGIDIEPGQKISGNRRIALLIGNSNYQKSPLRNPVNDANDMGETLASLGFDIAIKVNAGRAQMRKAIREFGDKLKKGGIGLFFYAGHGVNINGRNYLIPVGSDIQREDEVQDSAIDAGLVLRKMESAGNGTNIVFLDACRDNPFAKVFRSYSKGLTQMEAPSGTLIVYATAVGKVASDGTGRNSVFTKNLLKYIKIENLEITKMLRMVRVDVKKETNNQQIPSSMESDFYFKKSSSVNIPDAKLRKEFKEQTLLLEKKEKLLESLFIKRLQKIREQIKPLHKKIGDQGQTFEDYINSKPVKVRGKKQVLYIEMFGSFSKEQKNMMMLVKTFIKCSFDLKIKIIDQRVSFEKVQEIKHRNHSYLGKQFLVDDIMYKYLLNNLPIDAAMYLAFTTSGLWSKEYPNFVFGSASYKKRVSAYSVSQLGTPRGKNDFLYLARNIKVAMFVIQTMLGIKSCRLYRCSKNPGLDLVDLDESPIFSCPECMCKACWATQTEPEQRYKKIIHYLEKLSTKDTISFKKELKATQEFYKSSLAALKKADED